jgi:hypothetical protein
MRLEAGVDRKVHGLLSPFRGKGEPRFSPIKFSASFRVGVDRRVHGPRG